MHKFITPSFWIQLFISTLFTMLMIYLIKKVTSKVEIPVVNQIVEGV